MTSGHPWNPCCCFALLKNPFPGQFKLVVVLMIILIPVHQLAAKLPAPHNAFLSSFSLWPECERASRSANFTSAASTAWANKTGFLRRERDGRWKELHLKALVESGPALPPPQHSIAPPLLPTVLRSGADVCSHLLHFGKKIFLWGTITEEMAASLTAQLLMLCDEYKEARCKKRRTRPNGLVANPNMKEAPTEVEERPSVELIINSRGGSLTAGLALYDILSFVSTTLSIRTLAVGSAGHLGALFLAAGTYGQRSATKNARIFLCESAAHAQGSAEELLRQAASLSSQEVLLEDLMAKHTKQPVYQISKWKRHSQVLTAEEAKNMGFIDSIVGGSSGATV